MEVFWLDQQIVDLLACYDWLAASELSHLNTLRYPKRRSDWLLGRWTAKCTIAAFQNLPVRLDSLAKIDIRASDSGAPEARISGTAVNLTISISHSSGRAICAIAAGRRRMGCDIEVIEPRSDFFIADYFTPQEQNFVLEAQLPDRPRLVTLLWSAKESALKALQTGLRLDTRSVMVENVECRDSNWNRMRVRSVAGDLFEGWWRESNGSVLTIVADSPLEEPVHLQPFLPAAGMDRPASCVFQ